LLSRLIGQRRSFNIVERYASARYRSTPVQYRFFRQSLWTAQLVERIAELRIAPMLP
jgi:hypothetical protein